MQANNSEFDTFIFTHIPKCGGTSFREYIYNSGKTSNIKPEEMYVPGFHPESNEKNIPQLNEEELDKLRQSQIKVFACHSKYDIEREFNLTKVKNPFYFTILREPVQRFISHYYFFYFKLNNSNCKNIHLKDLQENKRHEIINHLSNLQVKWIGNNPNADLNLAINILETKYQSVGILEHISQSLDVLRKFSPDWITFNNSFPISNTNKSYEKYQIPDSIIDEIKNANALDMKLYKTGLNSLTTKFLLT